MGVSVAFLSPEEGIASFERMRVWLRENADLPAVIRASVALATVTNVHAFGDGNGRVARILANHVLLADANPGGVRPVPRVRRRQPQEPDFSHPRSGAAERLVRSCRVCLHGSDPLGEPFPHMNPPTALIGTAIMDTRTPQDPATDRFLEAAAASFPVFTPNERESTPQNSTPYVIGIDSFKRIASTWPGREDLVGKLVAALKEASSTPAWKKTTHRTRGFAA